MTLRAAPPDIIGSRQTVARGVTIHARDLPGESCRRCGGLLVASDSASLECDATGRPATLWRCVNCGDCMDRFILANRLKSPMPARRRARLPTGPSRTGRSREAESGVTR